LGDQALVVQVLLLGRICRCRLKPRRSIRPCTNLLIGQATLRRDLIGRVQAILGNRGFLVRGRLCCSGFCGIGGGWRLRGIDRSLL
jgi:hypothetical protein